MLPSSQGDPRLLLEFLGQTGEVTILPECRSEKLESKDGRWSGFGLELPWGERSGARKLSATRAAPRLPAIARSGPLIFEARLSVSLVVAWLPLVAQGRL